MEEIKRDKLLINIINDISKHLEIMNNKVNPNVNIEGEIIKLHDVVKPKDYREKPFSVSPGQVWMGDGDFPYQNSYKGEIAYVIKSRDGECWECVDFQEWGYGGRIKEFLEKEIRQMKYIGQIRDLRLR